MREKGRKRHTKCPAAAQLSAITRLTGSDKWALTPALLIALFSCCHAHVLLRTHTHTLSYFLRFMNHASGCHACKRPVHTTVCFGYWTCTDLCFHWPASPRNTLPQLQSSLIISCLLSVSPSPFLQQHQCACDKGLESSFKSRSLLGLGWRQAQKENLNPSNQRGSQWDLNISGRTRTRQSKKEWGWIQIKPNAKYSVVQIAFTIRITDSDGLLSQAPLFSAPGITVFSLACSPRIKDLDFGHFNHWMC